MYDCYFGKNMKDKMILFLTALINTFFILSL